MFNRKAKADRQALIAINDRQAATIREQHNEMAQLRRQLHVIHLNARAGTAADKAVAIVREICTKSAKYDRAQRYRIPALTRDQWDRMHRIVEEIEGPNVTE